MNQLVALIKLYMECRQLSISFGGTKKIKPRSGEEYTRGAVKE
jgi:hypothetical protein